MACSIHLSGRVAFATGASSGPGGRQRVRMLPRKRTDTPKDLR